LNGGYFVADLDDDVSVMAINSLEYNVNEQGSFVGPEATGQFTWMESLFNSTDKRKYLMVSHIYAGARLKHNDQMKASELWVDNWNKEFFDLVEQHEDKIIMEIAAHDHWADVRVFDRPTKGPVRSVYIAAGVSPI
jgi:hypothetical protein